MALQLDKLKTLGAHASALNFDKAKVVAPGERINLTKDHPELTNVTVEIYWESDKDGDIAGILLGPDGESAQPGCIVFYGQPELPGVKHLGDCRGDVDGDPSTPEETIKINLNDINADASGLLIVAGTYPKEGDDQTKPVPFGLLKDCRVLILNSDTSEVLYAFELDEDFSTFTSVELAKFYRKDGSWRYTNMGTGVGTGVKAMEDFVHKYKI